MESDRKLTVEDADKEEQLCTLLYILLLLRPPISFSLYFFTFMKFDKKCVIVHLLYHVH